ncbi:ABC transporter ATP-binding protein [Occultella aeris]|uniref:Putative multidrug resistance ABC transporter ATP-binding/permease protein YheI n=1 Tax=Occultella aeris TaxID=2761496 RepID=A0A7M4DF83_9MICO|nr:ABC transporter ATP-binding protein [Occultella aeris]VZO35576.1 putative multidrug resistance ABC transporter ATP-binding/permease protein YheI [Occultella aeris]
MTSPADAEHRVPTFRGPWSYLGWLVLQQRRRVALGAFLGTVWMVGLVFPPYLLSRAVDDLADADRGAVVAWSAILVGSGAVLAWLGIWRHRTMTKVRMDAAFRTVSTLAAQSIRLGAAQQRRGRAGEVVAIGTVDAWTLGRSLTVTGPGVGAAVAYVVIAVLLFQISTLLAVVVLCGVPVLALILGPALGPLQAVGAQYRAQQGALTGRIVDIIGGLTVLNGLGGKEVYADRFRQASQELQRQGYQVGRVTSLIQATALGVPTLFVAVVVWLAARLTVEGEISIGELVAVFGYAAVLVVPVSSFIEGAVDLSRALVAGRRVTDFLSLQRGDGVRARAVPADGDLIDSVTGLEVAAGAFTVIATSRQADAVALVDRLGGLRPGATWNGEPVAEMDPGELRRQLLVADNDAALFAGTVGEVVAGRDDVDEDVVSHALHVAAADDLVRALPDGLASRIDSHGSNLSGGQRQRLRLARAVVSTPKVLLAVDPTSAVDAATEANVVERLVRARQGRTTVVTSTSILMLAEADHVHFVVGDRLVASGTHAGLIRDEPAYAALVLRGETTDPGSPDEGEAS